VKLKNKEGPIKVEGNLEVKIKTSLEDQKVNAIVEKGHLI
jgi:hypothetical protein